METLSQNLAGLFALLVILLGLVNACKGLTLLKAKQNKQKTEQLDKAIVSVNKVLDPYWKEYRNDS